MNKLELIRSDTGETLLKFYPIVFNQKSEKPQKYPDKALKEFIEPGALAATDWSNCRAVVQHERRELLGRVRSGTLTLTVDDYGLLAVVNMGNTTRHRDTLELIERGDLSGASFLGDADAWEDRFVDGETVRVITSIEVLRDVSIVDDPAFSGALILKRSDDSDENDNNMTEEEKAAQAEKEAADKAAAEKAAQEAADKEKAGEGSGEGGNQDDDAEELKRVEAEKEAAEKKAADLEAENIELKRQAAEKADAAKRVELKRQQQEQLNKGKMKHLELIRSAVNGGSEKTLELKRAAGDGESTAFTSTTPKKIEKMSIMGKAPIWAELGVDYMPDQVGTVTLPYEDPVVGEQLAELASVTHQTETNNGTTVSGERFQVTRKFSRETLANITQESYLAMMENLNKGVDRKITAAIFAKCIAAGQAVAGVTAIDEDGFAGLVGAIDTDEDVCLLMSRSNFYAKKNTKADAGSGINLMTGKGHKGEASTGETVFFSTLFADDTKYAAADMSQIAVLDWNKDELIIDPYTLSDKGQVKVTFVRIMNTSLRNPKAVSKSGVLA